MSENLKYIIESLLFVSATPLTMDHLKGILEGEDGTAIRAAIEELTAEYEARDGGFLLKQVAGGYQFRTQGRYNEWIKRMIRPSTPRLSKAALETLAIIAYNQPIIRNDIEHIRGVDSGGVIRMLMERKLIRVLGRKEIPGRPLIYATTQHFLEVFELKDLKDLPTPKEIGELSQSRLEEGPDLDEVETEQDTKTVESRVEDIP
jgi:segregation and condensation protein B